MPRPDPSRAKGAAPVETGRAQACAVPTALPVRLESPAEHGLANAEDADLVPESSPTAFVAGFRRSCADVRPAARTKATPRAAGYAERPARRGGMRRFAAGPRTGQAARASMLHGLQIVHPTGAAS